MKKITEEEFYNQYELIDNHFDDYGFNGKAFENYGSDLEFVKSKIDSKQVISIMEIDTDEINNLIFKSGYHEDAYMFLISSKQIEEEFETIPE